MPPFKDDAQSLTHSLLRRAHSPDTANRIFADKIQHRPLFLKPSSPPPPNARDARRKARKEKQERAKALKPKPLSARQRRKLGLHDIPTDRQKYAIYAPLNRMWAGYIREVLGSEIYGGGLGAAAKLCAADLHGADLEVSRSRCPGRVGVRGIVVRDSRFAFHVVTKKDCVKLLPKEGTVFRVRVPPPPLASPTTTNDPHGLKDGEEHEMKINDIEEKEAIREAPGGSFIFEIHGDQFQYRSADRANKKFRAHFLDKL